MAAFRFFNKQEDSTIRRLRNDGWQYADIGKLLGRHRNSVAERYHRITGDRVIKSRNHSTQSAEIKIPPEIIERREKYLDAPWRDYTAARMNDPKIGYSALDRKLKRA